MSADNRYGSGHRCRREGQRNARLAWCAGARAAISRWTLVGFHVQPSVLVLMVVLCDDNRVWIERQDVLSREIACRESGLPGVIAEAYDRSCRRTCALYTDVRWLNAAQGRIQKPETGGK